MTILLVTDTDSVRDRVHASLAGTGITIVDHDDPRTAAETAYREAVDTVLVDMQVGSMGAMAVTRSIRSAARDRDPIPVTILLDRGADAFLAKRAGAANWVGKDEGSAALRSVLGAA